VGNARPTLFFHECPGPAGAAAEPAVATSRQLDEATVDSIEHVPWRVVDLVVAAQVTRVVIRVAVAQCFSWYVDATSSHQLLNEFRVMDNGKRPIQLRILVLECIEAVRTARDNALWLITLEPLDVCLSEDLIQVFVASSSGWIAAACFFFAKNGK